VKFETFLERLQYHHANRYPNAIGLFWRSIFQGVWWHVIIIADYGFWDNVLAVGRGRDLETAYASAAKALKDKVK